MIHVSSKTIHWPFPPGNGDLRVSSPLYSMSAPPLEAVPSPQPLKSTPTRKSEILKSGISQEEPLLQARRNWPGSLQLYFQRSS